MTERHCSQLLAWCLILSCAVSVCRAQSEDLDDETDDATESPASTVVYDQAYFSQYNVTTAEDMIRRIPGGAAILDGSGGNNQRGFGQSGDQILIDGQRMAAKSNDIGMALRRIRSDQVERVELIRGLSADIDVLSRGTMINIVRRETDSKGSGTWQVRTKFNDAGWLGADGLVSYSNRTGRLTYLFGLEHNLWSPETTGQMNSWTTRDRFETYFYPNGALMADRPQHWEREHFKYVVTANLTYAFENGDQLRLNGLAEPLTMTEDQTVDFTNYDASGNVSASGRELFQRKIDKRIKWELAGEYLTSIGPGRLSLLALYSVNNVPERQFRRTTINGNYREISRTRTERDSSEGIVRSTYSFSLTPTQSIEVGAEGARNLIDQQLAVELDRDFDGFVEPITFPTADSRVQELRGEMFANHNWSLMSQRLNLESTLAFEISEISNNFDFIPTSTYSFIKPRFSARYSLSDRQQIRLRVERVIGQLNMQNFVPGFDFNDSEVEGGNPELAPETMWEFELGLEHRLPDDAGVIEAKLFYQDIRNEIDRTALGCVSCGAVTSVSGNIADATNYGVEVKGSIRLGFIGLPDVVVDGRYQRQYPSTTDPMTGLERRMRGRFPYVAEVGFRHDVGSLALAYGASYKHNGGGFPANDVRERAMFSVGPVVDAFVEKQIFYGLILRLDGYSLQNAKEYFNRSFYIDNVVNGALLRTETRREVRDKRFILSLRGTF